MRLRACVCVRAVAADGHERARCRRKEATRAGFEGGAHERADVAGASLVGEASAVPAAARWCALPPAVALLRRERAPAAEIARHAEQRGVNDERCEELRGAMALQVVLPSPFDVQPAPPMRTRHIRNERRLQRLLVAHGCCDSAAVLDEVAAHFIKVCRIIKTNW